MEGEWSANPLFMLKPCMDLRITLQLKWDLRVSCIILVTKVFVKISEVIGVGLQKEMNYVKQQACDLTTHVFFRAWKGPCVTLVFFIASPLSWGIVLHSYIVLVSTPQNGPKVFM